MNINTAGAPAPHGWTLDQALRPVAHILRHGIEPPWQALSDAERTELLRQISPIDGHLLASDQTHAAFCMLPWYASAPLVRVVDPGWGDASIYVLVVNENLYRLNGVSPPIHEANLRAPLQLTRDTVLEYLKFFCFFVRGDEGPFYLLERADHPILTVDFDEETADLFEALARPPSCEGQNEAGAYLCSAVVFYGACLFEASFAVAQSGMVEMVEDDPIAFGLPVRFNAFLGAFP